jgi:DNA repair exonuclease SbcCD ATPase subunit
MSDKQEKKDLVVVQTMEEELASLPEAIETDVDAVKATDLILKVRKMFNEIEERRKERTAPASETVKLINEDYKKFLDPLKELEKKLKGALETYSANKVEKDLQHLETVRQETGDKELMLPVGVGSIPSANGEVRFRESYVATVVDEAKVPRKYKTTVVDMKAIQKDVNDSDGNIVIKGVEIKPASSLALYVK